MGALSNNDRDLRCNPDNPWCTNTNPCDPECGDPCSPQCVNCEDGDRPPFELDYGLEEEADEEEASSAS